MGLQDGQVILVPYPHLCVFVLSKANTSQSTKLWDDQQDLNTSFYLWPGHVDGDPTADHRYKQPEESSSEWWLDLAVQDEEVEQQQRARGDLLVFHGQKGAMWRGLDIRFVQLDAPTSSSVILEADPVRRRQKGRAKVCSKYHSSVCTPSTVHWSDDGQQIFTTCRESDHTFSAEECWEVNMSFYHI